MNKVKEINNLYSNNINHQSINLSDDNKINNSFLWENTKNSIETDLKTVIWNAWIKPLTFLSYKNSILSISTNSSLIFNRVETQYYEKIMMHSKKFFLDINKIEIKLNNIAPEKSSLTESLSTIKFDKEIISDKISFISSVSVQLNKNYTFSDFIQGESNQMALAAAKRVADYKTAIYNPLFLYGGVGLGKTHLLNAIAWHIKENNPERKVVYMSAERFMYQFIRALRLKDTIKFKDQFRSVDVLMIDDIQFIGGKGSTQEEFFHTFNDLMDNNKQIVITANKSPNDLLDLDERLRSRLGGGLVADFLPTDYDLRLRILNKKIEKLNLKVPSDVIEFLAHKITSNIRELEGAINRISANADLKSKSIDLDGTKDLLADILRNSNKPICIETIQKQVGKYFNITLSEMTSSRRSINIARPRQVAMFFAKQYTSMSYPEIGKFFGGKDHTTVMHAVKKITNLSIDDYKLKDDLNNLNNLLKH